MATAPDASPGGTSGSNIGLIVGGGLALAAVAGGAYYVFSKRGGSVDQENDNDDSLLGSAGGPTRLPVAEAGHRKPVQGSSDGKGASSDAEATSADGMSNGNEAANDDAPNSSVDATSPGPAATDDDDNNNNDSDDSSSNGVNHKPSEDGTVAADDDPVSSAPSNVHNNDASAKPAVAVDVPNNGNDPDPPSTPPRPKLPQVRVSTPTSPRVPAPAGTDGSPVLPTMNKNKANGAGSASSSSADGDAAGQGRRTEAATSNGSDGGLETPVRRVFPTPSPFPNPPSSDDAGSSSDANPPQSDSGGDGTGPALANGQEAVLVRRKMESDNNCLFTAISYLMTGTRDNYRDLREIVANTVLMNELLYSEAVLNKPPAVYAAWIMDDANWGGEIELAILSEHYKVEILAFAIQGEQWRSYGQGAGYDATIGVIWDGLHYDALVLNPQPGAPEAADIRQIPSAAPGVRQAVILQGEAMVKDLHRQLKFTDTATFALICTDCGQGIRGTTEAEDHARVTGHINFSENPGVW